MRFSFFGIVVLCLCLSLSLFNCREKDSGEKILSAEDAPPDSSQSAEESLAEDSLDKPILHVLLAASDTCRDSRLMRTYDAGWESSAADRIAAMEEFLLRQETGNLYSNIVIRTLTDNEFTKTEFQNAFNKIKDGIKASDTLIMYYSAYSGFDKEGDIFIIPSNGKKNSRSQNIGFRDIVHNIITLPTHKIFVLADMERGNAENGLPAVHKRLTVNLEGHAVLVMQHNSAAALMAEFEKSSGDERYVTASQFISYISHDFFILDRQLEQGTLQISSLFPGAVTITGNNGRHDELYLDSLESASIQLPEGSYSVSIVYRNSHRENRTVELLNNSSRQIAFTYRPGLSLRDFSGSLPAYGVNIAELNPTNYRNIDQNVLSTMGMEQYRIAFLAGEKLYQNGNYSGAIAEYNRSISLNTRFAEAYTGRGSAYRRLGNYTRAIEDYTRALEYGSVRPEVYNYRGFVYAERDETAKAIADFSQALRLNRNYTDAYINRAIAYFDTGDYEKAINDYTRVIQLEPRNVSAWNRRGSAWNRMGDDNKAIADFSQAISIQPGYAQAWHNRGNVLFNAGDYQKALADLNQAIRLSPSSAMYRSRGNIKQRLGDNAGAEADFAAAQRR